MKRKHLFPLILWTFIWGLFFATLLLAVERLPTGDFSGQFHAFATFQAREMAAGRLPVWSPGSYGGIPFTADTQSAVFYPLRWLTLLFALPNGFSYYLLELEGLLHIWLAGVFAYFLAFDITRDYARQQRESGAGVRPRLSAGFAPEQWAGLLAAVAFGLGGYLTSYPLLQLAVLESVIWLPLVLYLLRRGVCPDENRSSNKSSSVRWLMAAGIVLGITALAGHPQTFLHIAYLSAAYYLFLAWQARWRWSWIVGLGLFISAAAVGIAAASFIPAIRFVPLTVRRDVSYEFVSKGFPLLDAVQVLLPGYRSLWLPQYVGLVTIALAFLAWLGRKSWQYSRQRAETIFWVAVIALSAWLALGDKGVLYELAYYVAPGFSLFRQQERLVSLFVLGMAVLAAQGFVIWMHAGAVERRAWLRRTSLVLAALLLLVGFIQLLSRTAVGENDWLTLWIRQWLILALIIVILWPRSAEPRPKQDQWRSIALLALLVLDLFFPVHRAMNLAPESPAVFWPQPAWLDSLNSDEVVRIDGQNLFHANIGELHALEDIKGISPLKPQLTADLEALPRPLRWQLLNVKYVLADKPLEENLTQIAQINDSVFPGEEVNAFVYRFEDSLPRAWMVYDAAVTADAGTAFDLIQQPGFDPVETVILTDPVLAGLDSTAAPEQTPTVEIERLSSSELAFSVNTAADGILVISEWDLPGWQATMDGVEVPLLTADFALQGLHVPAGNHQIALTYGGRDAYCGLLIALLTLLISAVLAWRWRPQIPTRLVTVATVPPKLQDREAASLVTVPPNNRRKIWIMAGIALLGFGLRLFLLGNQELRGDEAFSYIFTQFPLSAVISELINQGDPHSPLHYLLLNIWVHLAGDSEFAMRWLSLLPGFLLIPVLYRLGAEMIDRRVGILAAFIAAISPSLIWLAQDVRNQYTLSILFTSLATWLLVNNCRSKHNRSSLRLVASWGLYAILAALAMYGHYFALFALLAHGLYIWFAPDRRRNLLPWIASGLAAALLFLPWLLAAFGELVAAGQLSDPGTPDIANYLLKAGGELIIGASLPGRWTRWLILGITAVVLTGFFALRRSKPGWAAMLMGWLAGALLTIFLIRFSRSTFNTFYVSVTAPAWILLLSAGALALWRGRSWRRALIIAAAVVFLGAVLASLRNYYFDPDFSRTLGYRQVASALQAESEEGDIFIAHFPDPSFVYYLRDVGIERFLAPAKAGLSAQEIEAELAQLAEENRRLWLVPYHRSVWDRQDVVPRWLAANNLQEQKTQLGRLELNAFRPLHSADDLVLPLAGSVDQALTLESALVTVNGRPLDHRQPLPVSAGSEIQTTLIWTTLRETSQSYTAFVHLLDQNGQLLAQHDGIPVGGTRPTTTWRAGETLLDVHDLVVPEGAQGSGRLIVGLYDSETLDRQELRPGQDALQILEIELK